MELAISTAICRGRNRHYFSVMEFSAGNRTEKRIGFESMDHHALNTIKFNAFKSTV